MLPVTPPALVPCSTWIRPLLQHALVPRVPFLYDACGLLGGLLVVYGQRAAEWAWRRATPQPVPRWLRLGKWHQGAGWRDLAVHLLCFCAIRHLCA